MGVTEIFLAKSVDFLKHISKFHTQCTKHGFAAYFDWKAEFLNFNFTTETLQTFLLRIYLLNLGLEIRVAVSVYEVKMDWHIERTHSDYNLVYKKKNSK